MDPWDPRNIGTAGGGTSSSSSAVPPPPLPQPPPPGWSGLWSGSAAYQSPPPAILVGGAGTAQGGAVGAASTSQGGAGLPSLPTVKAAKWMARLELLVDYLLDVVKPAEKVAYKSIRDSGNAIFCFWKHVSGNWV